MPPTYVRPQRAFADIIVSFGRPPRRSEGRRLSARLIVRPTLPFQGLRELVGSLRGDDSRADPLVDPHRRPGPMSVLDIDGDCPPALGAEIEDVLWSSLHPDERLVRDRIGMVRVPGQGEMTERSPRPHAAADRDIAHRRARHRVRPLTDPLRLAVDDRSAFVALLPRSRRVRCRRRDACGARHRPAVPDPGHGDRRRHRRA